MDDDGVPTPGGKSRYGRLDPRRLRPTPYADHPTPPEGYVNVWVDNFRRWQKRWLVATTPGVLIFHRRSTKIGPSTSVDLTVANVVVSDARDAHPRQFLAVTGDVMTALALLHVSARQPWVDCIKNSALKFEHARQLVRSRSLARAMPPRPSARAPNGSASVSGSASGSRAAAQGADRHASPPVCRSNQTLDPELRRHKLREAFFDAFEPARRRLVAARGRKRVSARRDGRRSATAGPGDVGRAARDESRDERVGVREQRDGAPFRDGARGGDREVRVGRGGGSSPRAGGAASAAATEFTGLGGGGEYAPSRSPATTPPAVAPPPSSTRTRPGKGTRAQGQNAPAKRGLARGGDPGRVVGAIRRCWRRRRTPPPPPRSTIPTSTVPWRPS